LDRDLYVIFETLLSRILFVFSYLSVFVRKENKGSKQLK
jgi:hypothetical protein